MCYDIRTFCTRTYLPHTRYYNIRIHGRRPRRCSAAGTQLYILVQDLRDRGEGGRGGLYARRVIESPVYAITFHVRVCLYYIRDRRYCFFIFFQIRLPRKNVLSDFRFLNATRPWYDAGGAQSCTSRISYNNIVVAGQLGERRRSVVKLAGGGLFFQKLRERLRFPTLGIPGSGHP